MKSWKLYVLCLACICSMAFLTGCGNDNTANGTENNVTTTEKNSEAGTAEPDIMNQNADPLENMSGDVLDGTGSDKNDIGTDGPADMLEKAGRDLADDVDEALTGQNY